MGIHPPCARPFPWQKREDLKESKFLNLAKRKSILSTFQKRNNRK